MFGYKLNSQRFSRSRSLKIIDVAITKLFGCLGPLLIPPVHIYVVYHFWRQYTRRVDRRYCTCSCWDTVFKGTYESGIASYKHVYFNATRNSVKIWVLTVVSVIGLYEAVRHIISLLLRQQLRVSMCILFLSSIFPHYYSWWSFFNYWNDDFYSQWSHQWWFSVSELVSTCLVLRLADLETKVRPVLILPIVVVATVHIIVAVKDQFFENVIQGEGSKHQILRDLGFMVPDILHLLLPLTELFCVTSHKPMLRWDLLLCCFLLTTGLTIAIYSTM